MYSNIIYKGFNFLFLYKIKHRKLCKFILYHCGKEKDFKSDNNGVYIHLARTFLTWDSWPYFFL